MSSALEERFIRLWELLGGAPLEREYRFYPARRWKADFAHLASRTLIEIEGGVWSHGRHTSPRGFLNDAEKYLTATLDGWSVLRLTAPQLEPAIIRQIIQYINEREAHQHLERGMETA